MVVNDIASLSTLKRYVDFVNPAHVDRMPFKRPCPYLCVGYPSMGIELMMFVRLGCLCVHERTTRYSCSILILSTLHPVLVVVIQTSHCVILRLIVLGLLVLRSRAV